MGEAKRIETPLTDELIGDLRSGDNLLINGIIYTGRDAAHKRLVDLLEAGQDLPVDLRGQIIYYVGPSPAPPGKPIGSAGPTTSYRMDPYTPALLAHGLKGSIGKGSRGPEVIEALQRHRAIYLAAVGGAAALIARSIKEAEIVAYEDLGPEAIRRLVVQDFPAVVVNDAFGGDLYKEGRAQYEQK